MSHRRTSSRYAGQIYRAIHAGHDPEEILVGIAGALAGKSVSDNEFNGQADREAYSAGHKIGLAIGRSLERGQA
jgi:hypothetical protein